MRTRTGKHAPALRRSGVAAFALACCLAGSAAAAAARVQAQHTPASTPATVTGCVRAGDQPHTFLLTVVDETRTDPARTQASAAGDRSTGTSPYLTGSTGATAPATTYKLVGDKVDFAALVGRRVEVTGTVKASHPAPSATAPPKSGADAKSTTPVGPVESQAAKAQSLTVTTARAVPGSCQ